MNIATLEKKWLHHGPGFELHYFELVARSLNNALRKFSSKGKRLLQMMSISSTCAVPALSNIIAVFWGGLELVGQNYALLETNEFKNEMSFGSDSFAL